MSRIIGILFSLLILSCTTAPEVKKEHVETVKYTVVTPQKDTVTAEAVPLVKDYVQRVQAFKAMPDATTEQQVAKYEVFSKLYVAYTEIIKNQKQYSDVERKNNEEAFFDTRDAMVSLKEKLKQNISSMTKEQENRLDVADAEMNALMPNVYQP
jgi:hypothetical protein